ncbi:alpha-L-fucosidase [uncultured Bacteroides sp.]|uniref:alpha-L-fucosidase n=1 Tax=uncultured Bacteroides sp. TaxID=162156 RepID=UPI002591E9C5|nr:alpha-L-fucosidase [uncultured Bacteroides sp.]
MKKFIFYIALTVTSAIPARAQQYFEKHVVFPSGATLEQKIDMASRLVPSKQQLDWQQMELTAFLHFGINTFTGREWGEGKEDPSLFNPTSLDCEQWVKSLKESGFKMAIITAKHHDGFCLWPTKTTQYSVTSSPWKEGKGDVVRELRNACKKYGLKFGVYLSPWDRNAKCYGQGDIYNQFFIKQLTELLTNYGEVHEVWFDGANGEGPNGKKQIYDWAAIEKTIRSLQPKAVTAIMGDDVRWVGNEKGIGRETEWSATVLTPGIYTHSEQRNKEIGIFNRSKDLGGREVLARASELYWYPSEVDVSIRPGWFYHADQNEQIKPLSHLVDIYFKSVGYNSVLLLNIPPDKRGLIHETDRLRLNEFASYLKNTFNDNFLKKGNSYWQASSGESREFTVQTNALVNTFMLQEDIAKGQRVEDFLLEGWMDNAWHKLAEGTTVGYKRLIRFDSCQPEKVRLTIRSARGKANFLNAGLFYAQPLSNTNAKVKLGNVPISQYHIVGDDKEAGKAIDGNLQSVWRTEGLIPLVVDLGSETEITGFSYAPATDENLDGTIYKYNFYVSNDGKKWTKCITHGEFSNIMHNPVPNVVQFERSYNGRYFKLEPLMEINAKNCTSIAEVGIFALTVLQQAL